MATEKVTQTPHISTPGIDIEQRLIAFHRPRMRWLYGPLLVFFNMSLSQFTSQFVFDARGHAIAPNLRLA